MKVLVCGSRYFNDYKLLEQVLDDIGRETKIDAIIHGLARGADQLGAKYAESHGIDCRGYVAEWERYGKRAGPIRNTEMLRDGLPDLVVGFLASNSRGTKHMIEIAQKAGVPVKVINI